MMATPGVLIRPAAGDSGCRSRSRSARGARCTGASSTRGVLALTHPLGDAEAERVAAGTAAEGHRQDALARLGLIQDGREPEHRGAGVGVADVVAEEAAGHLLRPEAELGRGPGWKLPVGLVQYHVRVIVGRRAERLEHVAGRLGHVPEVGRFAGEAAAMLRIALVLPAPEVGRVGDEDTEPSRIATRFLGRAHDDGGAARAGSVLQRIARPRLRDVHADCQRVLRHARAGERDRGLQRLGSGLAGELPVGGERVLRYAQRLGHDRAGRLHGIRVALAADPHGADLRGVDARAAHRIAAGLDGHRHHVLIQARHRLLPDRQRRFTAFPHAPHLARGQAVARHIGAVAGDADFAGGFHEVRRHDDTLARAGDDKRVWRVSNNENHSSHVRGPEPLPWPPTWQVPCHAGRTNSPAQALRRTSSGTSGSTSDRRRNADRVAEISAGAFLGAIRRNRPRTDSHSTSRLRARGLAVFSSCAWISRCSTCSSSSSSVSRATMSPLTREWNVPASSSTYARPFDMPAPKFRPGAAEHHDDARRHVLTAMVARALDDRGRARVAHREAVAGLARGEEHPAGCPIERRVTQHQVMV